MISMPLFLISLVLQLLTPVLVSAKAHQPLEDVRLRCCTLIETPIIFQNENMQEHLGFKCTSILLYNNTEEKGIGFTSFIRNMESCTTDAGTIPFSPECSCDIGVGGWMLNRERQGRVDFLPPFVIDGYEVLVHVDSTSSSTGGAFFLTAFSISVWGSVLTLCVVFTFLKLLDRRFAPPDHSFTPLPATESRARRLKHFLLKSQIPLRLRKAVESTLSRMVGQGNSDPVQDPPSSRHWILNFAIALCSLFLVLAYESSMTAVLVQEKIESTYRTVQDLKSCRVRPSEVCIAKGGSIEAFWRNSIAPQPCHNKRAPIQYSTYDEGVQKLARKECKFLLSLGSIARYAANHGKYCQKLLVTGEPSFRGGLSFVLPRGSNLTDSMSTATLQLRESGIIPTMSSYFASRGECQAQRPSTLTFRKLRLFFILVFGASFLIFLEMIIDPQTAIQAGLKGERQESKPEEHAQG